MDNSVNTDSAVIVPATPETNAAPLELMPIKDPIAIFDPWLWIWIAFGVLLAALAGYLLWKFWLKKKFEPAPVPPLPPHVRARRRLREALALINEPNPFTVAVSDIIRVYLEESFNLRAPERTTEEFLHELQSSNHLDQEQKQSLGEFLSRCDLVKFARYEPTQLELEDLHSAALRTVEETEPMPNLQAPAPDATAALNENDSMEALESGMDATSLARAQSVSNGSKMAFLGVLLQLAPIIWMVAYFVMIVRLLKLYTSKLQSASFAGFPNFQEMFEMFHELHLAEIRIIGEAAIFVIAGFVIGGIGIVLLLLALLRFRLRAEWFFWFLVIYGVLLLGAFPFGTPIGLFFLVYCLTHRREFLNPQFGLATLQPK